MRKFLILSLLAGLPGCGLTDRLGLGVETSDRALPFRATLRAADDPRDFAVTVDAPGVPLEALRESLRHPATRYCIERYGSSDIDWVIDPATGDWQRMIDGDDQIFSGSCTAR
jgi:hypothetical protein